MKQVVVKATGKVRSKSEEGGTMKNLKLEIWELSLELELLSEALKKAIREEQIEKANKLNAQVYDLHETIYELEIECLKLQEKS